MNKKISLGAAATLIFISVALTVSVTMVIAMRNFDYNMGKVSQRQAMFEYLNIVDKAVRQNYLGKINEDTLRAELAKGYVSGMEDPYAAYYSPTDYKRETERLSGKWTGLGLEIVEQPDGAMVVSAVHKNSSAEKAGLQKGDIITSFNGSDARQIGFDQVKVGLAADQKAKLTVSRNSESIAFEISESTYTLTSVESRMIGTIGYIRISAFYSNTPDQFRDAFTALESQGADKYIFDLRFNKGGSLEAAGKVISYLLPRGTYARRVTSAVSANLDSTGNYELTKPSVTLINGKTEGEAELFAGVMQEFKKTTLVGEGTAGKGMVQQFYNLHADGAAVKISVASLQLTSGTMIEGKGIVPGVEVSMSDEFASRFVFLTEKNDPQLIAAITTIKGGTVSSTNSATK